MLITVKTFNSHVLNSTDYKTADIDPFSMPTAEPVFLGRNSMDSLYTDTYSVGVRTVPLTIRILDYANRYSLAEQLRSWFKRGESGDLVVTFNDTGDDYRLPCVVNSIVRDATYPNIYTVVLQSESTCYEAVTAETDSVTFTATPETKTITVSGSDACNLKVSLSPTGVPTIGYAYQNLYQVTNPLSGPFEQPWCVAIDTAALVTAGKMQADCDDLRLTIDGVSVPRWLINPNTSATKVWFNLSLPAKKEMTLRTAVASGGTVAKLEFTLTADILNNLKALPTSGILAHGNEWFLYSSVDTTNYSVSVTKRGAFGTTSTSHNVGDTLKYIAHIISILYGNVAVTDPSIGDSNYNNKKPIFDLTTSSNSSWVYSATTGFYDSTNLTRPGSWIKSLSTTGKQSHNYALYHDSTGNPVMGLAMLCYMKGAKWYAESASIAWQLYHPSGFASVTSNGEKFWAGSFWVSSLAALVYSFNSSYFTTSWNETNPTVNTWSAWTHNSQAITGSPSYIRFFLGTTLGKSANGLVRFEVQAAQVDFTSANLPTGVFLGEKGNYQFTATIANSTTSEGILINYPMLLGKYIVVDSENYSVTYDGQNALPAISLDTQRDNWIRLAPGENIITLTNPGIVSVSCSMEWFPRRL